MPHWRAKRANLVVLCARFFSILYNIFPGQCHTVISNLAITRIILNPFYNPAVYTAYSEPTMHCIHLVGERERANLIVTTGTIFLYIYLSRAMPYRNRLRVSKLTQLTIFHRSSPRVYRHGDSSRRCTVATVQDEANPSSSQPAASCCVASESTEAHRDGWRQYVLAEESVLPRKQPKRKRGV